MAQSADLPRFVISKVDDVTRSPQETEHQQTSAGGATEVRHTDTPVNVETCVATEDDVLMSSGPGGKSMALYEEDVDERPFVSRVINKLAHYEGGIVPNVEQESPAAEDVPQIDSPEVVAGGATVKTKKKKKKKAAPKKLGTVLGVYFPCIQNIFGVLLFIRLVWIVGTAGWLESFIIAFMCCACTMTTSMSMSAVATNGVVAGGGSYFMISRALGPEFGGAVGILFYLGTTVASSMYIIGAVEIFLQYMTPPALALFGPINIPANAYNCYRVYGSILLLLMFICVFIGVKFVSKFSPIALFCVIFSILCVYIGIFISNPDRGPRICLLGDRLLAQRRIWNDTTEQVECHTRPGGPIYRMYCGNVTEEERTKGSDPDCAYMMSHNATLTPGIPGINLQTFKENFGSRYAKIRDRIGSDEPGDRSKGDIISDITGSFVVLLGIFFPSVTGIMAGSNRSGDLADAQKSIPIGTICAIATTSFVYLSTLLLFGASVEGQFLRDKFGDSIGGGLLVSQIAWPHPWVILLGSFLSTCGAGLQSLTGAPRLLQAIAADGVIPFINPLSVTNLKGEPRRALYLTATIAETGVLLANVDYIAPIITMFFLMCYCFTNLACVVQTLLRTPNWRPRFRFYHWILSMFGVCLCLTLMFITSWYYAIVAILIAAGIYKYIEYKGAEKEWGDGIRGLAMSAARFALLRMEEGPPHVKNWRPQLLVLLKIGDNLEPKYRKLLTFASQLKAGKGLTLMVAALEGDHTLRHQDAETARNTIMHMMKKEKAKGFAEVIVAKNTLDGVGYLIQGAGLGGLKHNTVMMGWPQNWRQQPEGYKTFIAMLRVISERHLAAMVVKGICQFPENGDRLGGTIDIWWIVHEGGLLMLLPFLLTQHKVWKKCKLRIFTVAQIEDNSIQMKKDLQIFLYHLRISAEVQVIEMPDSDISAYTYERTLLMEQRHAMLAQMKIKKKNSLTPQMIVDLAHVPLTQRRADMPLNKLSESPLPEDAIELQMPETATPDPSTDGNVSVNVLTSSPNHLPNDASVSDNPEDELQWNITTKDSEVDSNRDNADDTTDKPDQSIPKPSASHNLPKLIIPEPDEKSIRNRSDSQNMRRMTTAIRLNQVIRQHSTDAKLAIVNMPKPPKDEDGEKSYMDFLDVLTDGLERVLLVAGGGREVITIYS